MSMFVKMSLMQRWKLCSTGLTVGLMRCRSKWKKNFANLRTEISNFKTEVKTEFGEVRGDIKALNARMYGFEKQVEYFGNFPYWMLVLFGAILLLPFFNIKALQYTKTKNKIQEEKFLCCR